MKFSLNSIQGKVGSVLAILLLVNIITIAATFITLAKQEKDSVYVDVAGRQRMLSQKLTKETLLYVETKDKAWQHKLAVTKDLFERSLYALRDGNPKMGLTPTKDPFILKELDKLAALWGEYKRHLDTVLTEGVDTAHVKNAVEYLKANNMALLRQANEVTQAFKKMAISSISSLKVLQIVMLCLSFVVFGFSAWLIHAQVLRPLNKLLPVIDGISKGNLKVRANLKVKGELRNLAEAINAMAERLQNMIQDIKDDSTQIKNSCQELDGVSAKVFDGTSHMHKIVGEVAEVAENVDDRIISVTRASQELTEATTEIAQSVAHTASITNDAQDKASNANTVIKKLGESSDKIGSIIQVINTIAEQTNLLALNATIEAARAGEAGKGFAVVANEIKELARQTGEATEEITNMIQTIQSETGIAVESVEEITNIVAQINDLANTIASAAEEQTATVSEISVNMEDASQEVKGVKNRSMEAAELSRSVSNIAQDTAECSKRLGNLADDLEEMTRQFSTS